MNGNESADKIAHKTYAGSDYDNTYLQIQQQQLAASLNAQWSDGR